MAHPILTFDAEVTESTQGNTRLIIYFSDLPSAKGYYQYLQRLDDGAFGRVYDCKIDDGSKEVMNVSNVSMNLPNHISSDHKDDAGDVVLGFADEDEARKWEERMLVWTSHEKKKQSLSRSLTVDALRAKLGPSVAVERSKYEAAVYGAFGSGFGAVSFDEQDSRNLAFGAVISFDEQDSRNLQCPE
jgi:hypothetical protein